MIGKIYKTIKTEDRASKTIIGEMIGTSADALSGHYIVHNPCEVVFDISKPITGSAELTWVLKPYFYKDLIADSGVSYGAWAFPKSEVAISNLGGTTLHPNLLAAYKELCE
jgi:hypothetical protein